MHHSKEAVNFVLITYLWRGDQSLLHNMHLPILDWLFKEVFLICMKNLYISCLVISVNFCGECVIVNYFWQCMHGLFPEGDKIKGNNIQYADCSLCISYAILIIISMRYSRPYFN